MEYCLDENKGFFIENFLRKSEEALLDSKINIENQRLHNALNRIYYSIFYAVIALGYQEGFISSKHKQLMGWFNKKFLYEDKVFDIKMYEIYKEAYENRQESDYTFFMIPEKEKVLQNYEDAKYFVTTIKNHIENKNSLQKGNKEENN
jgi:uncharacterized protein (UPF0332 family)